MSLVEPGAWNAALDRALEVRAVDMVFAAQIFEDFSGGTPRLLDGMSSRGNPGSVDVNDLEALYLLSMVAWTGEPFACGNFLAMRKGEFVVGAEGPTLRDNGRGRREAITHALEELAAAPREED